ncbi:hypothetical protein, partial [Pseudomonas kulmbachensis]|uniref:hypothetical protein n=1 Tax=Pseudomonas kulmbachensis TaxID=3043408 RepID=UPI002AB04C46
KYEVGSLAFEFSGKDTALFGHLTPRYGEHSRLNGCPVSLDHYNQCQVDGVAQPGWGHLSDCLQAFHGMAFALRIAVVA